MRKLDGAVEERNYAKQPLTKDEIGFLVDVFGVEVLLNARHEVAKIQGWKDRAPAKNAFVVAAARDNNLLRRPIVLRGTRGVVGKDEAAIRMLLGG